MNNTNKPDEGKKRQQICHDDSTPPYDSFCFYCSGSQKCYSEDSRIVNADQPDCIHINEIKRQEELKSHATEFFKFCQTYKIEIDERILDNLYAIFNSTVNPSNIKSTKP